jgi:hypothetical protein
MAQISLGQWGMSAVETEMGRLEANSERTEYANVWKMQPQKQYRPRWHQYPLMRVVAGR